MTGTKLLRSVFSSLMLSASMAAIASEAHAVGVLYADPGWLHAFDGNSAYYHDPDGPHPDYVNGTNNNEPGGKSGQPGLIQVACSGSSDCEQKAIWQNRGSEWEGSAPGDPLGGPPNPYGTLIPPVSPPAPGGVGAFTDGATSFIRIQDPGLTNPYGWPDKGAQLDPNSPQQEGNNRRIEFVHEMSRDVGFSDTEAIIDEGVTISFRARIATAATGPLDMVYDEDGPAPTAWPTDGIGYPISNNARGMIMISQGRVGGATPPGRLAFSLIDDNLVASTAGATQPITVTKRGLIMNNRSNGAATPDTNEATDVSANVAEIPNGELVDWHEFWITVKKLVAPVAGNTHEVNVYMDGSLVPETFQLILGNQNEAGSGSFLGMGLTSGSRYGAFDLDFIAYKEGVHVPTLAPQGLPGDHNEDDVVDALDYVVWRMDPDSSGGDPDGYIEWRENYGNPQLASSSSSNAVPEPAATLLLLVGIMICLQQGPAGWRFGRSRP